MVRFENHVSQASAALRSRAADLVAAAEIIEERAGLRKGIGLHVGSRGTHSIQFDNDALEECEFLVWNASMDEEALAKARKFVAAIQSQKVH